MRPKIRAVGQGVRRDLAYTGDCGDSPDFGEVGLEHAMQLIAGLPQYPREAADAELCPPTITLVDESGASLTASRSVEGGYDIYFSGPYSGDVATNASLHDVRELVTGFYSGRYPEAVDYVKATGEVPGIRGELLSYMTLRHYYDFDSGESRKIGMSLWREPDGSTYFDVDREDGSVVRIPLEAVVEVVFRRGGFLWSASMEIRYRREGGGIGSLTWRVDKENEGVMGLTAAELSRYLPGRVRLE